MRTIVLSKLRLTTAAACLVAAGCEGEIRPPKQSVTSAATPGASDPVAKPPTSTSQGGASAPNSSSGTGDDRAIGSLSTRELVDVCMASHENLARALSAQVRIECTASSLNQSGGCESARDKCVDDYKPDQRGDERADCETEASALAQDCATVTIAALRACEQAWIRKLEGTAEQLGCDSSLDRIREMSNRETPAECQNIDTRCRDKK